MGKITKVAPLPVADKHTNQEIVAENSQSGHLEPTLTCLQRVRETITNALETVFSSLGLSIGHHPYRYILACILVCGLSSLGLLAFSEVADPDRLWVPRDAQVLRDQDWVKENFPLATTREEILAESETILTPTGLAALLDLYVQSLTVSTSSGITLSDVCVKAGSICVVNSILEIWSYDSDTIRSLTQDQIISDINSVTTSPLYGNTFDVTNYLGDPTTNSSGTIISAKVAVMTWFTKGNEELTDIRESWENKFIDLGLAGHPNISTVYVLARKSFREEARRAAYSDAVLLGCGHLIVIVFVVANIGTFTLMEQKVWLTIAGFISIGLAELVSISLSSALGQAYGPIQSVLPFLLLGLGVDDMFVIIQALNSLSPEEQELDIPQKMAAVLRHAGVSITVTSLTDFAAFVVGATTIIPALQSFCIYAAVGVASLYVLQAIFFTSFLALDLRRLRKERDACLFCCVSHPSPPYTPKECSKKQLVPFLFREGLANIITKLPFKVVVLLISLAFLSVNMYGAIHLEQFFDRNWLLSDDSYAKQFITALSKYFPETGLSAHVFCGNVDYWGRKSDFETLSSSMENSPVIYDGSTDSWFSALTAWLSTTSDTDVTSLLDAYDYPVSEAAFMNLTYRLSTEVAPRTNAYLSFSSSSDLDIETSLLPFRHIQLNDPDSQTQAMDDTRAMVQAAGFSLSECFPYSSSYLAYETNKVIQRELYRNIGLALMCVFVVTLVLIANLQTSLLVFLTVLSTLVNVAGTMYFWDLTIDIVTSVILTVSTGLTVDYSAHIGHKFMTVKGTKQERTRESVAEMGPAVFYGGFSTFLAFSLLTFSDSYIFRTFFEVNFLIVLYGLFNGLVLLPVLLSWFGPEPHPTAQDGIHSIRTDDSIKEETEHVKNQTGDGKRSEENIDYIDDNSVPEKEHTLVVASLEDQPTSSTTDTHSHPSEKQPDWTSFLAPSAADSKNLTDTTPVQS